MIISKKSNARVNSLRRELSKLRPKHDTPIGVIHPYWARKPLNIVDSVIRHLTQKGDLILDPFSGSGTIPFSAISNQRNSIATDLNPLSIFITRNIFEMSLLSKSDLDFIREFFLVASDEYSKWFLYDGKMIERIRYEVSGEYKGGKFHLIPNEIILKSKTKKGWKGRTSYQTKNLYSQKSISKHTNRPINFTKIKLPENSRIAIPKGATLAHYFDSRNAASINLIYEKILSVKAEDRIKDALLFILSSALPLLRLSDKKASSQWPYWRPKTNVTSRNPLFVIEKKIEAFQDGSIWAKEKLKNSSLIPVSKVYTKDSQPHLCVFKSPAQNLIQNGIMKESVDLVFTDPPYADQAPYLEYSELWNGLLLKELGKHSYSDEIVKTDAPSRKKDNLQYIGRLSDAFETCCSSIKIGGFFVFFYQDRSLSHWLAISKVLEENNFAVCDVISLPKQRRSLKTVTSPGRTFDGDLLIVARKEKELQTRVLQPKNFSIPKSKKTIFEKYAHLIREGLVNNSIDRFLKIDEDVVSLIEKHY